MDIKVLSVKSAQCRMGNRFA